MFAASGKELEFTLENFEILEVSILRVNIELHFCHGHIHWKRSANADSLEVAI